jgi:hypothetical protein
MFVLHGQVRGERGRVGRFNRHAGQPFLVFLPDMLVANHHQEDFRTILVKLLKSQVYRLRAGLFGGVRQQAVVFRAFQEIFALFRPETGQRLGLAGGHVVHAATSSRVSRAANRADLPPDW